MQRKCGECSLCCKLLPLGEMGKKANMRCPHQRHQAGGCCKIYPDRPPPCKSWSCLWILHPGTGDLSRPDRAHYVIDPMADYVTAGQADGTQVKVLVAQIWCDPKYPDAHRDPALRAFLLKTGRVVAMIRYSDKEAFVLAYQDGRWHECKSNVTVEKFGHSPDQVRSVIADSQAKYESVNARAD